MNASGVYLSTKTTHPGQATSLMRALLLIVPLWCWLKGELRRNTVFQNAFSHGNIHIDHGHTDPFSHVLDVCREKPIPLKKVD